MNLSASQGIPDLVGAVQRLASGSFYSDKLAIDGLDIFLHSIDAAQVRWVLKYLQPLSLSCNNAVRHTVSCYCLHADELVVKAIQYLSVPGISTFVRYGKNDAELSCARISRHVTLYCNAKEGVFWLVDFATDTIHIIYSSRTRQPSLEFARTIRNTVVAYLEQQGWVSYHAGAVMTDRGVLMIIGNSGAGKTSLILALIRCGARYIANERLLIRQQADGIYVLGYPMAIAVGIGTALQFHELSQLVDSPDQLLYPRSRFSKSRVARTPRDERYMLHDKLQLLPEELSRYVGGTRAAPGGRIESIVVPQVSKTPIVTSVKRIDQPTLAGVLMDNYMGTRIEHSRPDWIRCLSAPPHALNGSDPTARLSATDAVTMQYWLSGCGDTSNYVDLIFQAQLTPAAPAVSEPIDNDMLA